jgi:hypothetical protein
MTIRIALIGAVALAFCARSAHAQGRAPQRVVLSESVLTAMAAQKPKTKTHPTVRMEVRRSSVSSAAPKSGQFVPTSVREIKKASSRK